MLDNPTPWVVFQTWFSYQSEFVSIDKETDDDVMHFTEFGETNRLPCQSFDVGLEGRMLPFDLLGIRLADYVPFE